MSRGGGVEFDSMADASAFVLSEDRLDQVLQEQFECTFAWTNRAGEPVVVTAAYLYRDGCIWMCSESDRVRIKAIARDPRTAVAISSMGTKLGHSKSVSWKGTSEIIQDRDTVLWFIREIVKRYDPDRPDRQAAHVEATDSPSRVVIKFTPSRMTNAFDGDRARRRAR